MVTIDHASFPHVFEPIIAAVISNGDWPTILACRLLCTKVRDDIDAAIFDHVAVCRPPPSGRGMEVRQAMPPFQRIPFLPTIENDPTGRLVETPASDRSRQRQLALVRTIDYFGVRVDLSRFADGLTNLKMLRRPKSLDSPIVAPTFVDFRDVTSKGSIAVCSVPIVAIGVRPGCERLVLHLGYDAANRLLDDTSNRFDVHESVKTIELVYEPHPNTVPVATQANFGSMLGLLGGKLFSALIPAILTGSKVVFVGVEKMQPGWLRLPDNLQGQALVERVSAIWEDQLRGWLNGDNFEGKTYRWSEQKIKRAVPTFVGLEKWRAAAPLLEREFPQYKAPFCVDESLLVPGGTTGQYYEEWAGREAYERDPDSFWNGGALNHRAIAELGLSDHGAFENDLFDSPYDVAQLQQIIQALQQASMLDHESDQESGPGGQTTHFL